MNQLPFKDYLLVGLQAVLFIAYIIPIQIYTLKLPEWLCYSGLVMVILGIILAIVALLQINTKLSPFPTPVTDSKLLTTGAFAIARHPIYTSILLVTLGYAFYQASIFKFLIALVLLLLFYFKSQYEEQLLEHIFPEYKSYKERTGRFLPKLF